MTAAKARLAPVERSTEPTWSEAEAFACEVKAREIGRALVELDNVAAMLVEDEQVTRLVAQTSALLRSRANDLESEARRLRTGAA
jgi:hypothetical protein